MGTAGRLWERLASKLRENLLEEDSGVWRCQIGPPPHLQTRTAVPNFQHERNHRN